MVNGIDNQMMITRAAEYARQVADQVNASDKAKAFAAEMQKEHAAQETHTVGETEHIEHKLVRRDKDGGSGSDAEYNHPKDEKDKLTEEAEEAQKVMPSDTLGKEIDITV